jgi:hypothetical protein
VRYFQNSADRVGFAQQAVQVKSWEKDKPGGYPSIQTAAVALSLPGSQNSQVSVSDISGAQP